MTDEHSNSGTVIAPRRRPSITKNTLMNGVAQFASLASTLVFFPLLVKAFGPVEYGVYLIATAVAGFVLMFDLGIGVSTVRFVASRIALDDVRGFAQVVATGTVLLMLLGAVAALVIAAIGFASADIFKVTPSQAQLLRSLLLIAAAMHLWYWPTSVAIHALNGLERFDLVARTSLITTCANVLSIVAVLVTGVGPVVLMLLGAGVLVVTSLINIGMLLIARPEGSGFAAPNAILAREIMHAGIPTFVVSIALFLNREQVDRLVVAVFVGPTGLLFYEVAAKLSMLVGQVAGLPSSAVLPLVSGLAARKDDAALRSVFMRGGRYITIAVVPFVVVLAVLAGPFIRAWFGQGYLSSIQVAHILILAQLFFPPLIIGGPILIGTGRLSIWVSRSLLLALINLSVSLILVQSLGILGVALGTLVSSLAELPLNTAVMLREMKVPLGQWLRYVWPGYYLVPVGVAVAAAAASLFPDMGLAGVAVAGALAICSYWAGAYMLLLNSTERSELTRRIAGPLRSLAGSGRS